MFERIYKGIGQNKTAFFSVFFVVCLVTYAILYALDFYPEPIDESSTIDEIEETAPEPAAQEFAESELASAGQGDTDANVAGALDTEVSLEDQKLPSRIVIPKSGTDTLVLNPDSLDMNDLDNALLDGVVRHPQSASFNDEGNILIFGHSSYLPNVFNENFQAFNGIQDLIWGDTITLYDEDGTEHLYRVSRVYKVKASETIIDNTRGKAKLTIVTCNSFGSKDDRYIVEASLVESA